MPSASNFGPGLAHRDIPTDAFAQWVSVGGDVIEANLWFGDLAPEGPGRSSLVINREGLATVLSDAWGSVRPRRTRRRRESAHLPLRARWRRAESRGW